MEALEGAKEGEAITRDNHAVEEIGEDKKKNSAPRN
jgi:hypothetical protein